MESTRRDFLKTAAFLGGTVVFTEVISPLLGPRNRVAAATLLGGNDYPFDRPETQLYTACLQCHNACAIKVKIHNGVAVKIDGNPYSPMTMLPQIEYGASPRDAARVDGKLCPKGQAGVQTLYDPYRIVKVLKRAGKRGEGKWITIPFEQAINEIVNGGNLFGEGNVPGLKDIYVLRDAALAKDLATDAAAVAAKKMTLDEFKAKHKEHLDLLIDPDHPDLGPKNNQLVFMAGRIEHGRVEFAKRWLNNAFGSPNYFEHTTICEQSHHIAYARMTDQWSGGKWSGGKTHLKPDALNARFIIYFGTSPFEANFGPTNMVERITAGLADGRLKIAVVDPRLSKTAAKAWKWVPIRPGTDAALALGMIRWILDNQRYDAAFLSAANKAAAKAAGETTWTNATYLVRVEKDGPGALLRGSEAGLVNKSEEEKDGKKVTTYVTPDGSAVFTEDPFVVSVGGALVPVNPYDDKNSVVGDLLATATAGEVPVKTAFQLLRELVSEKSVEEWAAAAGVSANDIVILAREFTSYGKQAAAELYRGAVQHTNGYYNAQAIITLNLLIGNVDWTGGLGPGGGHWHEIGDKPGQPFPVGPGLHPGKLTAFGVKLTREGSKYDASTLFTGFPAKRPWYPFSGSVWQEVLPSAAEGYPYPIKALFLHMGASVYTTPAGNQQVEILKDPTKIPLFFACDIVIGEQSMYADYIFPDTTYFERFESTPHASPDIQQKHSQVRTPVVAPIPETVKVFGEEMPINMEAIMLAIAEKLSLPGYGPDGFDKGLGFTKQEDWYLKLIANIAWGDKDGDSVPEASDEELALFRQARRHLPKSVFDEARWKQALGDDDSLWRKVVYVINRGGRFEAWDKGYAGAKLGHPFGNLFSLYVENVAKAKNSMTGTRFSGLPIFEPIRDSMGKEIKDDGFDLQLITWKEVFATQSRTPGNYWTQGGALLPENYILLNAQDAERLGLRDGDAARLVSKSNPDGLWDLGNGRKEAMVGKVRIVQGIRPGVVGVSFHYGHWAYGATDVVVDGLTIKADPRRGRGLNPNAAMRADGAVKAVCLSDPIGGSASFYDTWVKVQRV